MKNKNAKAILTSFALAAAITAPKIIPPLLDECESAVAHYEMRAEQKMRREVVANAKAATVSIEADAIPGYECASHCGSGWFIDSTGDIQTANHVVNKTNQKIEITFADGTKHNAKVVHENVATDTTILHVDGITGHKFIEWGDSDKIAEGDRVFALGNPFHLGVSVTQGIVSAVHRSYLGQIFIQSDAALNPGNSGGPIIDEQGRAIGMSDTIYSRTRENAGIGFAIPANDILKILPPALRPKEKASASAFTLLMAKYF